MSPVFDCTTEEGRAEGVKAAVDAVRAGHVVVIPTDTVYGVGADAFSSEAVAAVLAAKGRGREMPPPVLVPNVRTVDGLATDVPAWARDLIREFWPGPLTLVFKAQSSLMWDLGETNGTVALRMPQDDVALSLLAEVGPMAVTSANRTGEPPATTVTEAAAQLGAAVSVYLDAGKATGTEVSTIIDCTGVYPVVLRHGAITQEQIDAVLEPPVEDEDDAIELPADPSPAEPSPADEQPAVAEPHAEPGETHER
jgi:tRNA threonylcarbamoyl adenosine modification protein (Sua5/YciO/YrdC/YwlC family)